MAEMSKVYQVSFILKSGKILFRKASQRDVAVITSDWQLDTGMRYLAITFEHSESAPIIINLDTIEYIDFRVL